MIEVEKVTDAIESCTRLLAEATAAMNAGEWSEVGDRLDRLALRAGGAAQYVDRVTRHVWPPRHDVMPCVEHGAHLLSQRHTREDCLLP